MPAPSDGMSEALPPSAENVPRGSAGPDGVVGTWRRLPWQVWAVGLLLILTVYPPETGHEDQWEWMKFRHGEALRRFEAGPSLLREFPPWASWHEEEFSARLKGWLGTDRGVARQVLLDNGFGVVSEFSFGPKEDEGDGRAGFIWKDGLAPYCMESGYVVVIRFQGDFVTDIKGRYAKFKNIDGYTVKCDGGHG